MISLQSPPVAKQFMSAHVYSVQEDMSLAEVVSFLLKHSVSSAPVVRKNEQGEPILIGILSEGDCLEAMSNEMFHGYPAPSQTAATIMKRHPICVQATTDVFAVVSIFVSHRLRHLPVLDDQRLVGMISRCDILRALDGYYREWLQTRDRSRFPVNTHELMNLRFVMNDRSR